MGKFRSPVYVLFDGECPFCIGWVSWIIGTEPVNSVYFVPGNSEAGKWLANRFQVADLIQKTVIVITSGHIYTKSEAVCVLLKLMGGFRKVLTVFCFIPHRLLDVIYEAAATHRQHLYLKRTCVMPASNQQKQIVTTIAAMKEISFWPFED